MFTAVSAGGFHGCALTGAGAAHCWGDNDFGQLGRPGSGGPVPEPVSGGLTFAAISSGSGHTCALTPAGAAYCWGDNGVGQLGLGLVPELVVDTPRAVAGGLAFDSIAAGSRHTCALTADGEAFCWGLADERLGAAQTAEAQCHDGGATNCVNTPTAAAGALRFDLISAGTLHTCGVGTDGTGYCWGDAGIGRLGTGMGTSADPAEVVGGLTFVDIDAGAEHTCGVTTDGEAFCWGANAFGQLGNGRLEESDVPVMVLGEIPPDDGS
jgi:alpha-tubulin suppressor-like RCC1 family protein